jgi:hypothetical protein
MGQKREGFPTRRTDPASHPGAIVQVIVSLAKPLPMADDRVVRANRASSREDV